MPGSSTKRCPASKAAASGLQACLGRRCSLDRSPQQCPQYIFMASLIERIGAGGVDDAAQAADGALWWNTSGVNLCS